MTDPRKKVTSLKLWQGKVEPQPLSGGITNVNFLVEDAGRRYVVRVGDDIPIHQVMRFNELAASRAAAEAGISPAVVYHEPGVLVIDFIAGKTLGEEDLRRQETLERALPLVIKCHRELPKFLRGPALAFWVFHVIRDYAWTLKEGDSAHASLLPALLTLAQKLEEAVGDVSMVFGHNDLLPANFIDDGERLWLIDWDYAGFNSPLFDLGGLASNNGLSPTQEDWMLETYFEKPADDGLRRRYQAMKCASLLRETLWSMVSEIHSDIDFDYAAYTAENLARFQAAVKEFQQS
ncbi:choline/ethanolamine kinase family protein [Pelagibius marinus]|uniref:choline/ethanolamine kinase family protein n=1 Tax=Pelagibius marinus TaxID=2762760 RepID=UPI001872733C|nr:choline/ethanolamine kinase family protein [Pelagibius marinus]